MGSLSTKEINSNEGKVEQTKPNCNQLTQPDQGEELHEISEGEKELIKSTWKVVEADVSKVGVVMFVRLFETHPDMQESFMSFKGIHIEEVKHSKQLKSHALRVMGFIQKIVSRLDHPEKMESLIEENGKKHYHYGAVAAYVDYVGPQFLSSIQPSLSVTWSDEENAAWISLFTYISQRMKKAMNSEGKEDKEKKR
ncbi:UNVERIFIED_CONTAM: hypothetical protein RMT77_010608 [Armadillidium vulgare]